MSLYLKSKNILFQNAIDKTIDSKNYLNKKLKSLSIEEIEKNLHEQGYLQKIFKIFADEELLYEPKKTPIKSLEEKVLLLKKVLPLRHLSILCVTYDPKLVRLIYSEKSKVKRDMQILLNSQTAEKFKKAEENDPEFIKLVEGKISPLLTEEENYLDLKFIRYKENLDMILLYDLGDYRDFSTELEESLFLIISKVLENQIHSITSLFVEEKEDKQKENLHQGLKHLFLYQKQRDFDEIIKNLLTSFAIKSILIFDRIDRENETYQLSSYYGMAGNIKLGSQFDILDILGAHRDNSKTMKDKIFTKLNKVKMNKVLFIQSVFLGGPEQIILPVKLESQDLFIENLQNLKNLRSLLEYCFLSRKT